MLKPNAYPIHFSTSGYERLVYKYQFQFNSILLSTKTASVAYFQNMKQKNWSEKTHSIPNQLLGLWYNTLAHIY